jgi:glycosyltransferase involved in cell wall biosynthesis
MPVYKTSNYLREAMDSILFQSFTDFELIVLDDCSPDNAEDILDEYTDSRIIRYKGSENRGLANVLNIGMEMARGKYIARMDSDDISLPNRLEKQIDFLETHPDIDLCSCGMKLFGARDETWIRESDPEKVKITALFFSPVLHASSVWRKDSFDKHGLLFRQEMVPAEDYDLWTRALSNGLKLVNLPQVLYKYRIHPTQATSQVDKSIDKCKEIQHNYIRAVLPTLSIDGIEAFPEKILPALIANLKTGFFDMPLLVKRLLKIKRSTQS